MHDDSTACPLPGCTVPDMGAPCACLECKAGWQMWPSGCVRVSGGSGVCILCASPWAAEATAGPHDAGLAQPPLLPTAALCTPAPLQCGNTGCATYKANTCECTSCPPGWRLNSGACTVSEETKSLLHLPVEPPQQDSALSGWDAMYQLEVNCSGGSWLSSLGGWGRDGEIVMP